VFHECFVNKSHDTTRHFGENFELMGAIYWPTGRIIKVPEIQSQ